MKRSHTDAPRNNRQRKNILTRTFTVQGPKDPRVAVDEWRGVKKSDDSKENDGSGSDWISSDQKKDVIKCAIAYTIATLFTFNPTLNRLISALDFNDQSKYSKVAVNAHNLASATVWFNPARSRGSMLQAILFALTALAFVTVLSLAATFTLTFVDFDPENEYWSTDIDEFIVAFVWIGIGSAIAAFARLKMANQTFNSAATMSCIVFYSVVVNNGGIARLIQYLGMAMIGIIISSTVCLLIWPKSSTSALRRDLSDSMDSFAMLLDTLFSNFTQDGEKPLDKDAFDKAVKAHDEAFVTLKAELPHALRERWLKDQRVNKSQIRQTYKHAVEAIERLAQHLTGLRSCLNMRDEMMLQDESFSKAFQTSIDIARKPMQELTETTVNVLKEAKLVFKRDSNPDVLTETRRSMLIASERMQRAIRKFDISSGIVLESSQPDIRIDVKSIQEPSLITQFYLFNLRELATELYHLLLLIDEISEHDLMFVFKISLRNSNILDENYQDDESVFDESSSYFSTKLQRPPMLRRRMRKTLSKLIPIDPSEFKVDDQSKYWRSSKVVEEESIGFPDRLNQMLWKVLRFSRRRDVKFAIKTGGALAILSMPSFHSNLRKFAMNLRLEWALISCFASLSPTVGQTNFMCFQRILGTLVGAAVAVISFIALGHSLVGAIGFPIVGLFFSLPCFYIVVGSSRYSSTGRFILQSYNLVALYAFNLREQDMNPITIAAKRSAAVTLGITFSMIVSRLWWPVEARKELRTGLGDLILDLGYLYNRHTLAQSVSPVPFCLSPQSVDSFDLASEAERASETTNLLSPQKTMMGEKREEQISKEFMSMELHIQIHLIKLRNLLAQTKNEPRIKGPFPVKKYADLLGSCQRILEVMHILGMVTQPQNLYARRFMDKFREERREMVGNVLLFFSVIASALYSKSPLAPYLPPANKSRQALMDKIQAASSTASATAAMAAQASTSSTQDLEINSTASHLLVFAYALCMRSLINELEVLGTQLQGTFGVIGNTDTGVLEFGKC
ncbi:hypothetical protein E3P92_00705 [Wallemia ichthyophaga]|uniref:Uncharacterized protein n=1 Tax=Wallemia ichthyophaga (strain EXF-994 / CBS 113033) TaxID=1299270 RepID=R9AHR9_WALI9|nr:uncharacterized protein J056_003985 [Wallemia ichthyophaga EXF-994]EOR01749.1 hypothetical protein J056_003985 [Wallemia ichthyophaga EXF-994]TIB18212.1 hypothetical protein E3P92_00705 [Wallemia ichthyophaga]TIB37046.1 hypothetical protein E3P84_00468 [Wallemia ichthyophaga]TIB43569.1 hypothetical protein E3P83_00611 [Wallemia ichthyophaga]